MVMYDHENCSGRRCTALYYGLYGSSTFQFDFETTIYFHRYQLSSDAKACADVNECLSGTMRRGPCGQICINTKGSFKCHCGPGFAMENDGRTCRAEDPVPLLVFATDKQIRYISVDGGYIHKGILSQSNLSDAIVGLDWTQNTKVSEKSVVRSAHSTTVSGNCIPALQDTLRKHKGRCTLSALFRTEVVE